MSVNADPAGRDFCFREAEKVKEMPCGGGKNKTPAEPKQLRRGFCYNFFVSAFLLMSAFPYGYRYQTLSFFLHAILLHMVLLYIDLDDFRFFLIQIRFFCSDRDLIGSFGSSLCHNYFAFLGYLDLCIV